MPYWRWPQQINYNRNEYKLTFFIKIYGFFKTFLFQMTTNRIWFYLDEFKIRPNQLHMICVWLDLKKKNGLWAGRV